MARLSTDMEGWWCDEDTRDPGAARDATVELCRGAPAAPASVDRTLGH